MAALVVGAVALRAGWNFGALLVGWFVCATLVSSLGRAVKQQRTLSIVAKGGGDSGSNRDARQVLANGGVFLAATALIMWMHPAATSLATPWNLLAVGALAAAGADTWATELGTLYGGTPWSVRTQRQVPVGTSGAVSTIGMLALLTGATVVALLAVVLGTVPLSIRLVVVITTAGTLGALTDTLVGAWLQERRWCPVCQQETEQPQHRCGSPTQRIGGIRKLENDAVNVLCTVVGGVAAMALALVWK